jgi:hypothetical protein
MIIPRLSHGAVPFFGASAKIPKATVSFVMSVRPSVRASAWKTSFPTGRGFIQFDIGVFFRKSVEGFKL